MRLLEETEKKLDYAQVVHCYGKYPVTAQRMMCCNNFDMDNDGALQHVGQRYALFVIVFALLSQFFFQQNNLYLCLMVCEWE